MIRHLKLTNFKKHADKSFEFTEGLNGIFGPNYTGKTTILYAILFALGGASHVPGTNLQKKGTNHGLAVSMVFDIGGMTYRVDRKKSGSYLYDNEGVIASGTSNVTEKIEQLLGMSVKRFRQLKYAEQKKAHALLTIGATELHKILEELTGLDQINTVMARLKEIISETTGALEYLKAEDLKPLREREQELHNESVRLEVDVESKQESLQQLEKELASLKMKHEELSAAKEIHHLWKVEKSKLTSSIDILQSEHDRLKLMYSADMDVEGSDKVFRKEEEEIGKLENELSDRKARQMEEQQLRSQRDRLQKHVDATHRLISQDSKDLEDLSAYTEEDYKQLQEFRKAKNNELVKAESAYENILKLWEGAKCPTCGREYDDSVDVSEQQVKALEQALANARESAKSSNMTYNDYKRKLSVREELENDIRRNVKSIAEDLTELEKVKADYAKASINVRNKEQIETLRETITSRRKDLSNMKDLVSRQVEVRNNMAQASVKLAEFEELLDLLKEPPFSPDELTISGKNIEDKNLEIDSLSSDLQSLKVKRAESDSDLRSCREKISTAEKSNETHDKLSKKLNTAKELNKYLRDNRDRYTGEVWDFFLGSASTFVSDCTNGAITEIQRTESGQFQFVEDDEVMGIKDASGAQEAIMGLSVQMALAQAAQCPLDILLVDEPTADMDAEHSMAVAGMLSTKGHQVIAISHREMDASLCNNVILLGE